MRGGHLEEHAAALVDGELGHAERDRALAHLAGCPACRGEVEAQRLLKSALGGEGVPVPSLDGVSGLLSALPGLSRTRRPPELRALASPDRATVPATRPAAGPGRGTSGLITRRAGQRRPVRPVPRPWRRRRILTAAALTAGLGVAAIAGLGGGGHAATPVRGPGVDPASVVYLDQHASTSASLAPAEPWVGPVTVRGTR